MPKIKLLFIFLLLLLFSKTTIAKQISGETNSPHDSLRTSLTRLNWAEKEIIDISKIISGKIFLYNEANETNFNQYSPKTRILHLATHAIVDNDNPMYSKMFFSPNENSPEDGLLNIYELYNMNLNADLTVLSACNTGTGKLVKNEGIMSLARSFMYAGCSNVVMSLWPVDDKSTHNIMKYFYLNIKEGDDISASLRKAKLSYLKNSDQVKSAPYYWAGFIHIGKSKRIIFTKQTKYIYMLIIFVVALIMIFIFRKQLSSIFKLLTLKIFTFPFILLILILTVCYIINCKNDKPQKNHQIQNIIPSNNFEKAEYFFNNAQYDSAIYFYEKQSYLSKNDSNWVDLLNCYCNIGKCLSRKGNYQKALKYLAEAQLFGIKKLGENHQALALLYNTKGKVLRKKGNFEEALKNFKHALFLLSNHPDNYQTELSNSYYEIGVIHYYYGEYNKSLENHKKALSIRLDNLEEIHPSVANSYVNFGIINIKKGDYENALKYYQKALTIRLKLTGENHPDISNSYLNLGVLYFKKGNDEKSLECYQKAIKINKSTFGDTHPILAGLYMNMGPIYERQGNYEKALEYYNCSLDIAKKVFGDTHPILADNYNNIGIIYKKLNQYEKAIHYYNKALKIYTELNDKNHPEEIKTYFNIGNVYSLKKEYSTAIKYYNNALKIGKTKIDKSHPLMITIYDNLGICYSGQNKLQKAERYFLKALNIGLNELGSKHSLISDIYQQLGELNQKRSDHKKGLEYFQKALISLVSEFNNDNIYSNPDLNGRNWDIKLISVLALKANSLEKLYKGESKDINSLKFAFTTYEHTIKLIEKIRNSYLTEDSKLFLGNKTHKIYNNAIQLALKLYDVTKDEEYKEKVYYISEQSKSNILRQALLESKSKHFAGIPDSLLISEINMKRDISFYNKQLFEENNKKDKKDSLKITNWQNKYFHLKRKYEKLIKEYENEYPDFFNLKYNTNTLLISNIQKNVIDDKSVIIDYFISDTTIIISTISKDNFTIFNIKKDNNFGLQVELLRSGVINRDFEKYVSNSYALYQQLIFPVREKIENKNLIIIPYGKTGYIPFEILLTSQVNPKSGNYKNLPYLLKKHQISYNYSSFLLQESMTSQKRDCKYNYIGFSPVEFNSTLSH